MSTRSSIGIHDETTNTVTAVYCHWDGYPRNNGRILMEYYDTPKKVKELISYGDISSLKPTIGVEHPFENPGRFDTPEWYEHRVKYQDQCTFYGRDRGEEVIVREYENQEELFDSNVTVEFFYVMSNGVWYMKDATKDSWELLSDVMAEIGVI